MRTAQATSVFLAAVIFTAAIFYLFEVRRFNRKEVITQNLSFTYYFVPGAKYKAVIGDVAGTNKAGADIVSSMPKEPGHIYIPSLLPRRIRQLPPELSPQDLVYQMANERGVVIADNFCVGGRAGSGPYCNSEPQARDFHRIIKEFGAQEAVVLYDVKEYKDLAANFLNYLKENNIAYTLTQNEQMQMDAGNRS